MNICWKQVLEVITNCCYPLTAFLFLNESSSLTKLKRGERGHSWLFNLPFVPCCEPQENPVMAAISCVFNMQDTQAHTYLAAAGDASIFLWLDYKSSSSRAHTLALGSSVCSYTAEQTGSRTCRSCCSTSHALSLFFCIFFADRFIVSFFQAVLLICHSCNSGLVTSYTFSTPWFNLQTLFHFPFSLWEV